MKTRNDHCDRCGNEFLSFGIQRSGYREIIGCECCCSFLLTEDFPEDAIEPCNHCGERTPNWQIINDLTGRPIGCNECCEEVYP